MDDNKLNQELETYRQLGEQDKNIDVATLMLNALQKKQSNTLTDKEKRWAYLIALGVPPFGLVFAVRFYFSDKDDGKHAAIVCFVLTVFSLLTIWLFGKILFSSSGVNVEQLQQIKPEDVRDLY